MLMSSVLWIPTPPSFGSVSMQRYFGVLHAVVCKQALEELRGFEITPLVPYEGLMAASPSRIVRALDKWALYRWRVRQAGSYDVVHGLSHGLGHLLCHLRGSPRTLATVHDLIPLRFPGELTRAQVARVRRQTDRLSRFDLLTTVSEFTAGEVMELTGIPRERIRVVENGIDQEIFRTPVDLPAAFARLSDRPYVLSVGSAIPRKNLEILPEVFAAFLAEEPDFVLVRAGANLPPELRERFCRLCGANHLIELGRIPDEILVPAYQHAALFFFPSLYEGFGLPVIEAMAAGTPVVCSNATSLPEVGKDAALYFDPSDPAEGAAALLEALSREAELVRRGLEHSRSYSWDRTMRGHLACYRELLA